MNFFGYIKPYLFITNGGRYTKHIYAGTQRIASKLGDIDAFGADPRRVVTAGHDVDGAEPIDFGKKYGDQNNAFTARFDSLGSKFNGKTLDDYVNGQSFCCSGKNLDEIEKNNTQSAENAKIEDNLYFYHPDHLGSTSMVTNYDGEVTQNVAYIPYGEVFVEERNGSWNTPYLFNAKELDEETGLYYYGARYLDPTDCRWLSPDPMQGKYPGMSPYQFCHNNPVRRIDPDGNADYFSEDGAYLGSAGDAEGYRLVNKDDWIKANKSAKKQFDSHEKAAISNEVSKQLADKEKVLAISENEIKLPIGFEGNTTEYIKYLSDENNKEYSIDVVLNTNSQTFEYSPRPIEGTSNSAHISKTHRNGKTIGNIHGHPYNKGARSESWTIVGESSDDQMASSSIGGVVMNIESYNSRGNYQYHYYVNGGNLNVYNGGTDAKSIISFMLEKLTGK